MESIFSRHVDKPRRDKRHHRRDQRRPHMMRLLDPKHRTHTETQITNGPAAHRRHQRQHHHAKEIHPLSLRCQHSGDRAHSDGEVFDPSGHGVK
jgi:hypothetical protein